MKRIGLLLAAVVAVGLAVLSFGAGGPENRRGGQDAGLCWYVVPSDNPNRWGGPNVLLLDGSGDDVPFQALITRLEALSLPMEPVIEVEAGTIDLDAPLRIGYSGSVPSQNEGVSIIGKGTVKFVNSGGQATDQGKFMMYFCPSGATMADVHNLRFEPSNLMAGGLYTNEVHGTSKVSDITVVGGEVAGAWFSRSWYGRFEGIRVEYSNAIGIGFSGLNDGHAKAVQVYLSDGDNMGTGGVVAYDFTAASGTLYPGEEVKLLNDAGAERGMLLTVTYKTSSTGLVIIGHGDRAKFVTTNVIWGDDSGDSVTIGDATIEDVGCALFASGGHGTIDGVGIEKCLYANDGAGTDWPLILAYSMGLSEPTAAVNLRNIRFESGNTGYQRKQGDTYIRCIRMDNIVIDGVSMGSASGGYLADAAVAVAGQGDSTSDISGVGAAGSITNDMAAGDSVYLWNATSTANDGTYTVEDSITPDGTTFSITDGDFTDATMMLFTVTKATRQQAEVCIDLQDVTGARIRNVQAGRFDTALVQIDSNCLRTDIRNVWGWDLKTYVTEGNWLVAGKHGSIISDSGAGTMFAGTKIPPYVGLNYAGKTGIEEITESAGVGYKTTLLVQDHPISVTDGAPGWGTVQLYTFPQGHIMVLGTVVDASIDSGVEHDTDADITDSPNLDGDFSLGTAGTADNDFDDAGEKTIVDSTAVAANVLDGAPLAAAQFDGTGGAIEVHLNLLIDDADIAGNSPVGVNGTVTIYWIDLGDY